MLNGTTGREYGYLNDDANLERTIKPAVDGNTIHSTIDANIQGIVEKYLKQFNEEHKDALASEELKASPNFNKIFFVYFSSTSLSMKWEKISV